MSYSDLSRKELQALAKVAGIRANMKTTDLIEALQASKKVPPFP